MPSYIDRSEAVKIERAGWYRLRTPVGPEMTIGTVLLRNRGARVVSFGGILSFQQPQDHDLHRQRLNHADLGGGRNDPAEPEAGRGEQFAVLALGPFHRKMRTVVSDTASS